jgi:signal peptidase II
VGVDAGTVIRMNRNWIGRLLMASVIVVDQLSKFWATRRLAGNPVDLPGPISLRLVFNKGAAFGSLTNLSVILAVVGTAVGIICWWRVGRQSSLLGAALLGGGALGNVLDRWFRGDTTGSGPVIDFLSFGSFPVFNIADMAVCTAVALIALSGIPRSHPGDLDDETEPRTNPSI